MKEYTEIIAIAGVVAATISAVMSFFTFRLQRTHNIKSVTPIIRITQMDFENILYSELTNVGSGIAIIKKITVSNFRGEQKNTVYDWLPKRLVGTMNYKFYLTSYENFVVQAGQKIDFFKLPVDTNKEEEVEMRQEIRGILRQLTIQVVYEDIYNNKMPVYNLHLHHFGRTDNENSGG